MATPPIDPAGFSREFGKLNNGDPFPYHLYQGVEGNVHLCCHWGNKGQADSVLKGIIHTSKLEHGIQVIVDSTPTNPLGRAGI